MGKKAGKIAVIAAVTTLAPTLASPQQAGGGSPGGVQFDVGVSSSAKSDSNFSLRPGGGAGTSYIEDTKLSFGLSSSNSRYDFLLASNANLRFADLSGISSSSNGLDDPNINLRFSTASKNSQLVLTGRYRDVDRNFLNPFQVEQEEQLYGLLVGDGGTLRERRGGLLFQTGMNGPLGFLLDASERNLDYSSVINPLIFNNKTDLATGTVTMRLSPVLLGRVSTSWNHYIADDLPQTDRITTNYAVGATYDLNSVLQADGQIGYSYVTTDTLFGQTKRNGLTGALTLTKTVPNGTMFGMVVTTRNQNGARTNVEVGRDMLISNGTLRGSIGVTSGGTGGSNVIGTLSFSQSLRSSTINFGLGRVVSTNGLNQDVIDTRIGLGYSYAINNISSLGLNFNWGKTKDTQPGGGQSNISRSDLTASYSRNMTKDWQLTSGVTYRKKQQRTFADADSTAIFLTLGRTFSYRP